MENITDETVVHPSKEFSDGVKEIIKEKSQLDWLKVILVELQDIDF